MSQDESESKALRKTSCDSCGSSDANVLYSNGTSYCFSCKKWDKWDPSLSPTRKKQTVSSDLAIYEEAEYTPLLARKITKETCEFFGVKVGADRRGNMMQLFPYYVNGHLVGVKGKDKDKNFTTFGNGKNLPLFGANKFGGGRGKLIITEGEIDAMSVSQIQNNKWPVVSLPNGAASAAKSIKNNLEYVESFDEVILMFDMDAPGREAAIEVAELLTPGKAKISFLPMKDANELLVAGEIKALTSAIWEAKPYRPDGIVGGKDDRLWELVSEEETFDTIPYPWDRLNDKTKGIRTGELVVLTAGSGVGKSAVIREIAYWLGNKQNKKVGMLMLEESVKRSTLGMMGLEANRPLHISKRGLDNTQLRRFYDKTIGTGNYFFYDHFGSTSVDNLLSKVRYMAKGLDCKYIILDHLSIVVSGLEDNGGNERQLIDQAMTKLRTLVQETGVCLFVISHLSRGGGGDKNAKSFEEGGRPTLNNLRGSHGIVQLADMVLALQRDQQGERPNETVIHVLKNRYSGETGEGCKISYSLDTGRIKEIALEFKSEPTSTAVSNNDPF